MRKYAMNRFLYTLVLYVFLPFVPIKLIWRGIKQPEYRKHWRERFGFYSQTVKKPIIWLHCVSVGETRAAAPLVNALFDQYPHHQILLSHTTPTGRDTSTQLFGDRVQRVYLPYDLPFAVNRFIRHFKPSIGVLMETELWFNLITSCKLQNIPLLLVNARLSEKSAKGYAKLGKLAYNGLKSLAAIAAQTPLDAERLQQLGAQHVQIVGNIKFDVTPPTDAVLHGRQLRSFFGEHRPVFLAASTRDGEECIVLEAINQANIPHLVTIIVPRHPQRFHDVEIMLQQRGLHYQKRSTLNQAINAETQVILGDSMGELFTYYASADICLVGGSLLPFGGQNLIEPMRMGKPVLIGENTFNFKEVAELAVAQSAAWRVQDSQTISQALHTLFENPHKQVEMGEKGLGLCMASQGATQKTLDIIAQRINAIT